MTTVSAGHKLGQLIGDWHEEYFVLPLLQEVAKSLNLFVDSRFAGRKSGGGKILWEDMDGNAADYDFVLELGGSLEQHGSPVAFIECFWRRGARHSKDKARDDSGKLTPMRETYPTARFLGIIAAGDFTQPARELIRSRGIDLFYLPKEKITAAFSHCGLTIDYPDRLPEAEKAQLAEIFEKNFTSEKKQAVQQILHELTGAAVLSSYLDRVKSALSSLPQEIRFVLRQDSAPVAFKTVAAATDFLQSPHFSMVEGASSYLYQITYSDGSEFERTTDNLHQLKILHQQTDRLVSHMNKLCMKRQ